VLEKLAKGERRKGKKNRKEKKGRSGLTNEFGGHKQGIKKGKQQHKGEGEKRDKRGVKNKQYSYQGQCLCQALPRNSLDKLGGEKKRHTLKQRRNHLPPRNWPE